MFNWHDCTVPGRTLANKTDCRPYKAADNGRCCFICQQTDNIHFITCLIFLLGIPSKVEIAGLFDEAFNRLYMQNYNVSIVRIDWLPSTTVD